jgi:hypothetical protein
MEQQKYSCDTCKYTTNKKSNYYAHVNRKIPCKPHNLDESFIQDSQWHTCVICKQQYKTKFGLTVHMRSCNGISSFECSKCHIKFASKQSKSKHVLANICKPSTEIAIINTDNKKILTKENDNCNLVQPINGDHNVITQKNNINSNNTYTPKQINNGTL